MPVKDRTPEVRFVKLEQKEKALKLCQLTEQFFSHGQRVLIRVDDENRAVSLDRFLWTWNRDSFIPHAFDNGSVECLIEPVVVTTRDLNPNNATILILGSPCSVNFMSEFASVIDFAEVYDPVLAEESRQRFRLYKGHGMSPQMYSL